MDKVKKTPEEWRAQLSAQAYHITQEAGTEAPHSGQETVSPAKAQRPKPTKPKASRRPATKASPSAPSAAASSVSVQVDVKQRNRHFDWGMVYLNGRAIGMAPIKGAKVPAGSLAICIHNEASGIALRANVKVSGTNMKFEPFDMAKAKPGRCP